MCEDLELGASDASLLHWKKLLEETRCLEPSIGFGGLDMVEGAGEVKGPL